MAAVSSVLPSSRAMTASAKRSTLVNQSGRSAAALRAGNSTTSVGRASGSVVGVGVGGERAPAEHHGLIGIALLDPGHQLGRGVVEASVPGRERPVGVGLEVLRHPCRPTLLVVGADVLNPQ